MFADIFALSDFLPAKFHNWQQIAAFYSAVLRIRDVYPGSEFFPSLICIKEFQYFTPKNRFFKLSEIWSRLFIPDPDPQHCYSAHPGGSGCSGGPGRRLSRGGGRAAPYGAGPRRRRLSGNSNSRRGIGRPPFPRPLGWRGLKQQQRKKINIMNKFGHGENNQEIYENFLKTFFSHCFVWFSWKDVNLLAGKMAVKNNMYKKDFL